MIRPCVVIPNYNHKDPIGAVLEGLKPYGLPVLMVDDGSGPEAKAVFAALAARHPFLTLITRAENGGKGAAVKDGLREAKRLGFTHAVQMDADGQHDLGDLPRFLEAIKQHPKALVLGQPVFDQTAPRARLIGRQITTWVIWLQCLSLAIKDGLCGFRAYPLGSTVRLLDRQVLGNRMDFDPEIAVWLFWEGLEVISLPTQVRYLEGNLSNYHYWSDNLLVAKSHLALSLRSLALSPYTLLRRLFGPKGGPDWFEKKERTNAFWVHLAIRLFEILGPNLSRQVMVPVIWFYYLSDKRGRAAVGEFLAQVALDPRSAQSRKAGGGSVWGQYFRFGDLLLDRFAFWRDQTQGYEVEVRGQEWTSEIKARPQGAIFLSAHLGSTDFLKALSLKEQQRPVHAIMFNQNAQAVMEVLRKINPQAVAHIFELNNLDLTSIFALKEVIDKGEFLGVLGDRLTFGAKDRYSMLPFLGRPAPFGHGPLILASLLECPVYIVFALKTGPGRFEVRINKLADQVVLPKTNRTEALEGYLRLYLGALEEAVCAHPDQWTNFFPFWEAP